MPATHCRAAVFHEIQRLVLEYDDTVASHDSNFDSSATTPIFEREFKQPRQIAGPFFRPIG